MKLAFNLKDADKIQTNNIIEWHTDLCTYIHHSVPYLLIHYLFKKESELRSIDCDYEYSYQTLQHTYIWLYSWFLFIYIPWRLFTHDEIYTVLNIHTPQIYKLCTIFFVFTLSFFSNEIGKILQNKICI